MADKDSFFIGWDRPPEALRPFLFAAGAGVVGIFMLVGYLAAATMSDPGNGAFRFDWGRQTLTGVMQAKPYPMVHVLDSARFDTGHTLLLSGGGKRGVQGRAESLDGAVVQISGVALKRGDLDMIQLRGGRNGLAAAEGDGAVPAPVDLGRWRLTGEICDGKCYAGAMRPGTGLAHKACANLCLIGGVPPVFVITDTVDGEEFLVLASEEGGNITDAILSHTALLVEIEGRVERHGAVLIFRIDPATIRRAS
ncbi:MAG: hypothetical protein AAFR57_00725 [Pseudomonadota bacterium]